MKKKSEEKADKEENIVRIYRWKNKDDRGYGYHILPMDGDEIETAIVQLELVKQKLLADYDKMLRE